MLGVLVDVLATVLLATALTLATIALYGILRKPGIFDQLHAGGLVTGPAVVLVLLASVGTGNIEVITSAGLVILFVLITSPLSTPRSRRRLAVAPRSTSRPQGRRGHAGRTAPRGPRRAMRVEAILASVADTVRSIVEVGGYPALVLLIFAESILPPIPSELVLPLAGFYVGQGALAFLPAVAFATIGSLTGAFALYALGRYGGRRLVLRYGRVLRVTEDRLERAESWTTRHGDAVVLFGRMIPGARSIVSIPAGMAKMSPVRFAVLTTSARPPGTPS